MTVSTISALPTAPQVTDTPTVFSERANTFVAALSTLVSETNTTVGEINDALAGALVTFAAFQGDWSAGTYALGDVVLKTGVFYISLTAGNTDEPPTANWQALNTAGAVTYDASAVALTATDIQDAIDQLCTLPSGAAKTTGYTLTAADTGGMVRTDSTVTVPSGVFSVGDTVVVYNNSASSISIARSSVTMYWIDGLNEDRTLAQRGLATLVCVDTDVFVITGQGLS